MIVNSRYTEFASRAARVRDTVDGEYRLKQVDLSRAGYCFEDKSGKSLIPSAGYLRYINPVDRSQYNIERNRGFISGARLFNATTRTLSGMMGMLFRVDPVWPELNDALSYLEENADSAGLSLDQQSQLVSWNVLQVGRHGLLADMPRTGDGEITQDQVDSGIRPSIQQYTAENIIDYNESVIAGSKVLDLLVLREYVVKFNDNRIDRQIDDIYRVYRLTDGVVTLQMYDGENGVGSAIGEEIEVLGGGDQKLTRIPFSFVGSVNNNPDYDLMPLEPLTDVNLGHYQESANLRASSHQFGAAQLVISDDRYRQAAGDPDSGELETGESSTILLGSGGKAEFVSTDPNTISSALMEKDEERMVALGAQLVSSGSGAETAEAARIKHGSDVSVLENISVNVSDAYDKMLRYCHVFMGVDPSYLTKCSLNRDFYDSKLTAQEIDAVVRTWQSGAISKAVLDAKLQAGKVIGESFDLEEMNEIIDEESGENLDFDGGVQSVSSTTKQEQ